MTLPRRRFCNWQRVLRLCPPYRPVARADTYPSRPVRLVVGFYAGSGPDILARIMAQWLSERLGQQFVVDNRPGAGGNIGTEEVTRAARPTATRSSW